MGFWVMLPVYLYSCLIQDTVIKKVVVIMKVVVIGKRNIVVAFIYISMDTVLSRTAHRWRGLLIIFPYFGDGSLSMKNMTRLVQKSYHI